MKRTNLIERATEKLTQLLAYIFMIGAIAGLVATITTVVNIY